MIVVASIALVIWLYLLLARGAFWRCGERDNSAPAGLTVWPRVAAIVPARNEADCIGDSIGSLLRQDYAGRWTVVLVDDDSADGTADIAHAAAQADDRLRVVRGRGLPAGWTGKLWALKQGIDAAMNVQEPPDYLLLTDADIVHSPESLSRLVAHAESKRLVLTSLMVKLRCESFAEHANIPAFIFFFQMLYPFRWVNRPQSTVAAAAGGCMLVRADSPSQGWRDRGHSRRLDRRLRPGESAEGPRSDLARVDRTRAQYPPLPGVRRHPAHGGALGLRAIALLAASFCWEPWRAWCSPIWSRRSWRFSAAVPPA